MAVIHVLDKHTAELIAAGEVVERPASVVKELTENAIDAGASAITVAITGGGITKIEIQDNGCGIDPEDMHNAFVSHATSKISNQADLENIHTLGFRGEALASVAGVARVELLSKTADNDNAFLYRITGGQELSLEEAARPQGTTITVSDLFYNTPARMKFLKKDVSEAGFVQDAVEHLALSHPEISFRFIRENKESFFTPGDGRLSSAAAAIFPRDYTKELVAVNYEERGMCVTGLVTPPRAARASRSMQNFYVNGRYVKSTTMVAATENAYRGILMGGRFPGCILNITLPAELVDVNVHPAKTEVRFAHENDVFSVVYKAVKAAVYQPESMEKRFVAETPASPAGSVKISYQADSLQQQKNGVSNRAEKPSEKPTAGQNVLANAPKTSAEPLASQQNLYENLRETAQHVAQVNAPKVSPSFASVHRANIDIEVDEPDADVSGAEPCTPQPSAFAAQASHADGSLPISNDMGKQQLAADEKADIETPLTTQQAVQQSILDDSELRFVGEIFSTYILAERHHELCVIDKHAAHERLIYEQLSKNYGSVASQMLLLPESVNMSAAEKTALLEQQEYLAGIGFEIDDFGGNTVIVRAVPADITVDSVGDTVLEIAAKLVAGQREPLSEKTTWVLHSIACRAAVKAGDHSRPQELLRLAEDIMNGTVPPFCPHGRPVVLKITEKELEKQFGRLG